MINIYNADQHLTFTTEAHGFLQPHGSLLETRAKHSRISGFNNSYAKELYISSFFLHPNAIKKNIPRDTQIYNWHTGFMWARIDFPCSIMLLHGLLYGYPDSSSNIAPQIYVNNFQIGNLQKGNINIYDELERLVWSSRYTKHIPKIVAELKISKWQQTHVINNPYRTPLYALIDTSIGFVSHSENGPDYMQGIEIIFHSNTEIETRVVNNGRAGTVPYFWNIPIAAF